MSIAKLIQVEFEPVQNLICTAACAVTPEAACQVHVGDSTGRLWWWSASLRLRAHSYTVTYTVHDPLVR